MHVKGGTRLTYLWAAAGFIWLLLMFCVIMMDFIARGTIDVNVEGWEAPIHGTPVQPEAGSGAGG
jgi:hypothetical protein